MPIDPSKLTPYKVFVNKVRAELIPNGSLPKICSEEAFRILQRRNEIKLKDTVDHWSKDQAAMMRNILRHVDQTWLKGKKESILGAMVHIAGTPRGRRSAKG